MVEGNIMVFFNNNTNGWVNDYLKVGTSKASDSIPSRQSRESNVTAVDRLDTA